MSRILVVGAGPTGLTLAAVLARHGVVPRVIDRAVAPPDDRSRAIVIQARTLELFEDLGVVREVLDAGLVVEAANLFTRDGARGSLRIKPEWIDSRYGRFVGIPQEETERILGELVSRSGVEVERGVELVGLEEAEAETTATLLHSDGRLEQMAATWVVGCDGAHSAVRRLSGIPFPGETYRDECLLGDVDMRWSMPDGQVAICPGGEGLLLAFPLPGVHRFRVIIIVPATAEPERRELQLDEFARRLRTMAPLAADGEEARVMAARWLTRYRLHRRGVPTYRKGRSFVAGDAAHIHSPAGAQGMNTGIQDAYNLGWKLALTVRGDAPDELLDTYHAERHPVGELLLSRTDRMFGVLAGGGATGRLVRRVAPTLGVRLLAAPLIGRRIAGFVSQMRIRYRHSALSADGPGARGLGPRAPRAGDRAPDASLGGPRRLHDLLHGPCFKVLLFAGDGAERCDRFAHVAAALRDAQGDRVRAIVVGRSGATGGVDAVDLDGAAHERYGAAGGAIYLVRPDGYLGFRGGASDAQGLHEWFARWLAVPAGVGSA